MQFQQSLRALRVISLHHYLAKKFSEVSKQLLKDLLQKMNELFSFYFNCSNQRLMVAFKQLLEQFMC